MCTLLHAHIVVRSLGVELAKSVRIATVNQVSVKVRLVHLHVTVLRGKTVEEAHVFKSHLQCIVVLREAAERVERVSSRMDRKAHVLFSVQRAVIVHRARTALVEHAIPTAMHTAAISQVVLKAHGAAMHRVHIAYVVGHLHRKNVKCGVTVLKDKIAKAENVFVHPIESIVATNLDVHLDLLAAIRVIDQDFVQHFPKFSRVLYPSLSLFYDSSMFFSPI